jgi:hypothetical protein
VIALALEPALVLARIAGLSLDDVQALTATGYFREMRSRGYSLRAIARRFSKSLRTVATLSKQASDQGAFAQLGERMTLQRKLVAHIARNAGATRSHLPRAMSHTDPQAVHDAITQLIDDGIVIDDNGKLRVVASLLLLTGSTLDQRLDSVRHFLDACTQTLYQRFFTADSDEHAFARVLSFVATPEDLKRLGTGHYESLKNDVVEADARATATPDPVQSAVVFGYVRSPGTWWTRPRSADVEEKS